MKRNPDFKKIQQHRIINEKRLKTRADNEINRKEFKKLIKQALLHENEFLKLPNECSLALMLPDQTLEDNVLYLKLRDDKILEYQCKDPQGKIQKNTIEWKNLKKNGATDKLKPKSGCLEEFEAIKTAILRVTSKRGHTLPDDRVLILKKTLKDYFKASQDALKYNDFLSATNCFKTGGIIAEKIYSLTKSPSDLNLAIKFYEETARTYLQSAISHGSDTSTPCFIQASKMYTKAINLVDKNSNDSLDLRTKMVQKKELLKKFIPKERQESEANYEYKYTTFGVFMNPDYKKDKDNIEADTMVKDDTLSITI